MKLSRSFYARPAVIVARELLGKRVSRRLADGSLAVGRIVETEAYLGPHDLASHSRAGRTARTATMFGPPGRAYVYLIYGMHSCLNIVTGDFNGEAVLLRALEPIARLPLSTRGPGRLCKALDIDRSWNGVDLLGRRLWITNAPRAIERVKRTPRIGVDYAEGWANRPLRFCLSGNPWVSGPKPLR